MLLLLLLFVVVVVVVVVVSIIVLTYLKPTKSVVPGFSFITHPLGLECIPPGALSKSGQNSETLGICGDPLGFL